MAVSDRVPPALRKIELDWMNGVPLRPRFEMLTRRQTIPFLAIAAAVRQDEVVAEIHWIPRPWEKVIDMGVDQS